MKSLRNILLTVGVIGTTLSNPVFSQSKAEDYVQGKILNKHYEFDKSDLTKEDSVYVAKYFDFLMKSESNNPDAVCFEGWASSPGSDEYNDSLSFVRARKLADYFESLYPGFKTEIHYFGEVKREFSNDSTNRLDQVVKVIPRSNDFYKSFKVLEANPSFDGKEVKQIGFLDKSWSMVRNGAWGYIQGHDFSQYDTIYAFSRNGVEDIIGVSASDIDKLSPGGSTCYYTAKKKLLSKKETRDLNILTVMNGADNVGGSTPDEIVKEAIEKNISLSYLYLSPDPDDSFGRILREMAHKTKGAFTCVKTCE
jgi:hypothetical protein